MQRTGRKLYLHQLLLLELLVLLFNWYLLGLQLRSEEILERASEQDVSTPSIILYNYKRYRDAFSRFRWRRGDFPFKPNFPANSLASGWKSLECLIFASPELLTMLSPKMTVHMEFISKQKSEYDEAFKQTNKNLLKEAVAICYKLICSFMFI